MGSFCLFSLAPQFGHFFGNKVTHLGPLGVASPGAGITIISHGESSSVSCQPHFAQDIVKNSGLFVLAPNGNGITLMSIPFEACTVYAEEGPIYFVGQNTPHHRYR